MIPSMTEFLSASNFVFTSQFYLSKSAVIFNFSTAQISLPTDNEAIHPIDGFFPGNSFFIFVKQLSFGSLGNDAFGIWL